MFKRLAILLVALLLVFGAAVWIFQDRLAAMLLSRAAQNAIGVDVRDSLPDGLHILFCGTGSPAPDPTRETTCNVVVAGDKVFVFDIGSGAVKNIVAAQLPLGAVDGVYLTHLHSDHMDGLGELMILSWLEERRTAPLPLSGPAGVETVAKGLNLAYSIDRALRTNFQNGTALIDSFGYTGTHIHLDTASQVVLDVDGVKITAIEVNHQPVKPAFGYRVDYGGRSLVISGDTVFSPNLIEASKGADLLVHEALSADMIDILAGAAEDKGDGAMAALLDGLKVYHTTPAQAARAAQQAGVDQLILTHLAPGVPSPIFYGLFLGDARSHFDGPLTIAEDGMFVSLPAGSDEIIFR